MAVTPHADSVIPGDIASISETLYEKLLTMESVCYDNLPTGVTLADYQTLWTTYCNAWLGYRSSLSLTKSQCYSFITSFYSFCTVHMGWGVGNVSLFDASDAGTVFNSNGVIDRVLSYSDDYYNDAIAPVPTVPPDPLQDLTPTSARMDTDILLIEAAGPADISKFDNLIQNEYPAAINEYQMGVLFGEVTSPEISLTKSAMWDIIFIDLKWQSFFESIGQGSLVPTRP